MMDFSSLPASVATEEKISVSPVISGAQSIEMKDESLVYQDLSSRLIKIETKTDIERDKVSAIESEARQMMLKVEEKQELLMRCQWLYSLYTVKEQITSIQTMNEVQSLRSKISPVQTCPLKKELMEQLSVLEQSFEPAVVELSAKDALIEAMFEARSNSFINLGIAGRDAVITDVLSEYGTKATIEAVQEHTEVLVGRVEALTAINDSGELIKLLDNLPIPSFHVLSTKRKSKVAEALLENKKWNGLVSLDRMIKQLNNALTNKEQQLEETKNVIVTSDGKAALTLDIKSVVDGKVQLG